MWKPFSNVWVYLKVIFLILLIAPCWASLPWLEVKDLNIVDGKGQTIHLNGVNLSNNVWGNWVEGVSEKLQAQGQDPMIRPEVQDDWVLTAADFERLKDLGPKVVRYAIDYELFAQDNPSREANLLKLKQHINKFDQLGIYTMVSLHNPEGLDVQNDDFERDKSAQTRLKSIFEDKNYWQDTLQMWQYLAKNLLDQPGVAGYYLFNEPRLPSDADGGMQEFQRRYNQLCSAIRAVDKKHIIFVPEYNSRERNFNEDGGSQGVVWEKGLIKVNHNNVVYAFSFYEPYEFTHLGETDYEKDYMEEYIKKRVRWAKTIGRAPLLVCEYGVNRNQSSAKRLEYLDALQGIFKKYELPAILWEYKSWVGPFIDNFNVCGLYGQYVKQKEEVIIKKDGTYAYQNWVQKAVEKNDFDAFFKRYFWNRKSKISLMDNQQIWQNLHNFYTKQ